MARGLALNTGNTPQNTCFGLLWALWLVDGFTKLVVDWVPGTDPGGTTSFSGRALGATQSSKKVHDFKPVGKYCCFGVFWGAAVGFCLWLWSIFVCFGWVYVVGTFSWLWLLFCVVFCCYLLFFGVSSYILLFFWVFIDVVCCCLLLLDVFSLLAIDFFCFISFLTCFLPVCLPPCLPPSLPSGQFRTGQGMSFKHQ